MYTVPFMYNAMIINFVISNQRLFSQVLHKDEWLENILCFVYTLSRSSDV